MPNNIQLDNGEERFTIFLNAQGRLNFIANSGTDPQVGDTRLSIDDDDSHLRIGGPGQSASSGRDGAVQLLSASNVGTVFIGTDGTVALALLGGLGGFSGAVRLENSQSATTIDMNGSTGNIVCTDLRETSDLRLKKGIAPLLNALDKVLAMRGVRYQSKQEDSPKKEFGEDFQIGFIGQEIETVCPEIVSTDSEGYKSLNYSRLTPILVEAIKEQQQLIQRQASALQEAVEKIARIETAMKEQNA